MRKIKFLFLIMLFVLMMPVIKAKSVIQVIEEGHESDYKISGNYGWTFNMKNAKALASSYHVINNKSEAESHNIYIETDENYYKESKNYYISDVNDCTSKKIYFLYKNVGMYQGKKVNLKITVTNCKIAPRFPITNCTPQETNCVGGNPNKTPNIGFALDTMQLIMNGLRSVDLDYEFLDDDNNSLNIKGYGTFADLDFSQAFKMGEGVDKAYIYENYSKVCQNIQNNSCTSWERGQHLFKDKLTKDDNYSEYNTVENAIQSSALETFSDRSFKYAWSTILFSGGGFKISYYLGQPGWENGFNGGGMFRFYPDSLIPFDIEDPVKSVNKTKIEVADEYTYTISHRVPYINKDGSNNLYTEYSFYDKLEPCLTVNDKSKISIINDEGTDVTSNFNIELKESDGAFVVDASAKEDFLTSDNFYGHEYEFIINTEVKDDYDLSDYLNKDETAYVIPNEASISVKDKNGLYPKKTNKVNVTIDIPKDVVEVDDTAEFVSSTLIVGGSIIIILAVGILVMHKKKANLN